jgi:hypothetical protein
MAKPFRWTFTGVLPVLPFYLRGERRRERPTSVIPAKERVKKSKSQPSARFPQRHVWMAPLLQGLF